MTEARRWLTVEPPPWAEAHLALDAIVAFVDDELAAGPHARATTHLAGCPECAAEVRAQHQARSALRSASAPSLPSSLLSALRAIPQDTDLPEPPAGLAVTSDGQFVTMLRAPVTHPPRPSRRSGSARWVRFGAGAVVSGVALGALMIVAPPTPTGGAPSPAGIRSGVAPGAAVNADLRLGGGSPAPAGGESSLDGHGQQAQIQPSSSMFRRLR